MTQVAVPIQYDKEKKYYVDINATLEKAKEELQKEGVKSIVLKAKGNDINKVSLVAIQLEEEQAKGWKVTSMKTAYETEKDPKDNTDKKHLFLNIVV